MTAEQRPDRVWSSEIRQREGIGDRGFRKWISQGRFHSGVVLTLTLNSNSSEEAPLARSAAVGEEEAEGSGSHRNLLPDPPPPLSQASSSPNTDAGAVRYLDEEDMEALCEEQELAAFREEELESDARLYAWEEYGASGFPPLETPPSTVCTDEVLAALAEEQERECKLLLRAYAEYAATTYLATKEAA